jgi:hypothetical protein
MTRSTAEQGRPDDPIPQWITALAALGVGNRRGEPTSGQNSSR